MSGYLDPERFAAQITPAGSTVTSGFGPVSERVIYHSEDSTRDYFLGLLQIVGSTEEPRSVTVRYKLLSGGTNDASSKSALSSDQAEEGAASAKTAAVTSTFALRHVLASKMADDLRQILHGRSGSEAAPSADNREIIVTAPPEVVNRVQSFIIATDWPDAIERGSNYQYPRQTAMRAARTLVLLCVCHRRC